MKRKTQDQKIKQILKEAMLEASSTMINNCSFIGVQYDAKAVDAITTIADGLVENAKALGKLAEVLKASNVKVESMVNLGKS